MFVAHLSEAGFLAGKGSLSSPQRDLPGKKPTSGVKSPNSSVSSTNKKSNPSQKAKQGKFKYSPTPHVKATITTKHKITGAETSEQINLNQEGEEFDDPASISKSPLKQAQFLNTKPILNRQDKQEYQ